MTLLAAVLVHAVHTQQPAAAPVAKPDVGIPITDQTVLKACGSCHRPDDKGQMSRISFQRKTPEGWETSIRRMASSMSSGAWRSTRRFTAMKISSSSERWMP